MKVTEIWKYKLKNEQGALKINSVIYNLSGSKVIVAVGSELLVYDAIDGTVIKSITAHKESILCLAPLLGDGFASGGQDKQVMIWSCSFEGTFKYSHNDVILSISQNPINGVVLTCTETDFGLWAPDMKAVPKTKVQTKILCSAWSSDGKLFALGLQNGQVSMRSPSGKELARIDRKDKPVRALSWSQAENSDSSILTVADLSKSLSFYKPSGEQVGKDKSLNYEPFTISQFKSGGYMVLGGSNNEAGLWTADGIELGVICDSDSSILSCNVSPNDNQVVVGTEDGIVAVYQIDYKTIYALWNDQIAIRNNMVDVVIHNLSTGRKIRLKCKDYIKKIALHQDILAIQFPAKTIIYEQYHEKDGKKSWKVREKIQSSFSCDILLAAPLNLLRSSGEKLERISFSGEVIQDWNFDSQISFAKVLGAEKGQEMVILCLSNGKVFQFYTDISKPIPVINHKLPVIFADINSTRTKLAVIDEENTCTVYDLESKKILYQELYVSSVVWHEEIENAACITGIEQLTLKIDGFTSYQCPLSGSVVGFKEFKVYCIHGSNLEIVDIPIASFPEFNTTDTGNEKKETEIIQGDQSLSKEEASPSAESKKNNADLETFNEANAKEKLGQFVEAVELLGKGGHTQKLVELAHRLPLENRKALLKCVEYLKRSGDNASVLEILQRIGDVQLLLAYYLDREEWQAVFKIGREHPELNDEIFLIYGNDLMSKDRFEEAQEYYVKAGRPYEATKVLKHLADGNIIQERYELAAYYYFCLSNSYIANDMNPDGEGREIKEAIRTWGDCNSLADIYYCYQYVNQYIRDPFTFSSPLTLMNAAKLVLQKIKKIDYVLSGISQVYLYYCIAKVASQVGCIKLSQKCYAKLQSLLVPVEWQNTIDLSTMLIQSKPSVDSSEYSQDCAQCNYNNPEIGGYECTNCLEPFVYSFYSFEALPLVRFVPEKGISEGDTLNFLKSESPNDISVKDFSKQVFGRVRRTSAYSPITFNKQQLLDCDPRRVFIKEWKSALIPNEYYFLNSTEIYVILCKSCNHFFAEEEWNYQVLLEGSCSFCRSKSEISCGQL